MTAAYICAWPGGQSAHDTKEAAEAEVARRNAEDVDGWRRKYPGWRCLPTLIAAVAYRVDVEPDVRGEDYWNRARGMAA